MKALFFLLLLLGLGLPAHAGQCVVDDSIAQKVQEGISSLTRETNLRSASLECQSATSRGSVAACPGGFVVTGCACGSACGSWDVPAETTCHCQCRGMDWTTARCCRLQVSL